MSTVEFGILMGFIGIYLLVADFIRHYNDWD